MNTDPLIQQARLTPQKRAERKLVLLKAYQMRERMGLGPYTREKR